MHGEREHWKGLSSRIFRRKTKKLNFNPGHFLFCNIYIRDSFSYPLYSSSLVLRKCAPRALYIFLRWEHTGASTNKQSETRKASVLLLYVRRCHLPLDLSPPGITAFPPTDSLASPNVGDENPWFDLLAWMPGSCREEKVKKRLSEPIGGGLKSPSPHWEVRRKR